MGARLRIDDTERRARLGQRHALAPGAQAPDVGGAADAVVALHATDPVSVFLAARARTTSSTPADVERALYDERSVVRLLAMRRTMFVVAVDLLPVLQAACAPTIAAQQRRRLVKDLSASGVIGNDDAAAWLAPVEAAVLDALDRLGEASAAELGQAVPSLRTRVEVAAGTKWAAVQGIATRTLLLMGLDGHVVRGRPRGSWISTQYRWSLLATWLGDRLPEATPDARAARTELARRWLRSFGPGAVEDLRWWTGWTAGHTKAALTGLETTEVDLDGGATGLVLADDVEPDAPPEPWVALLPALDPTTMGWQQRGWYLGAHRPALFDRNGNAGPTVWADGRIVGGWAQRTDGQIAVRLLEDVGAEFAGAIDEEAERLRAWLGAVRFTPRFRTPLERELSG